jgi:hypothetical protein
MTTTTYKTQQNVVKDLRKIRDQISSEIKAMTFEEERAYLDKLLNDEREFSNNTSVAENETDYDHRQQ